jgi:hypothetical protein
VARIIIHTPGRSEGLIESEEMVQPSTVAAANSGGWNDVPTLLHPLRHALDGKIITGFFTTEDTVSGLQASVFTSRVRLDPQEGA